MKAEEYTERRVEIEGWPVNLITYKIGETYHAQADNVSPGACIARTSGPSRENAEAEVLATARRRLRRTRVQGT